MGRVRLNALPNLSIHLTISYKQQYLAEAHYSVNNIWTGVCG